MSDNDDKTKEEKAEKLEAELRRIHRQSDPASKGVQDEIDQMCLSYLGKADDEGEDNTGIRNLRNVMAKTPTIPAPNLAETSPTVPAPEDTQPSTQRSRDTSPEIEVVDSLLVDHEYPEYTDSQRPTTRDRILVIDDESDILDTLCETLEEEGYSVWRAANGLEGFERLFEMRDVDLILLDWWMPKVNGGEFLKLFDKSPWADGEPVPVVIISARFPFEVPDEQQDRYVFIAKPFNEARLLRDVLKQVQIGRTRRTERKL